MAAKINGVEAKKGMVFCSNTATDPRVRKLLILWVSSAEKRFWYAYKEFGDGTVSNGIFTGDLHGEWQVEREPDEETIRWANDVLDSEPALKQDIIGY